MLPRFCNTEGTAVTRMQRSGSHTVKARCSTMEPSMKPGENPMLVLVEHYLSQAGLRLYDEEGQGLIEYVLIVALISVAAIAAIAIIGPKVSDSFTRVGNQLT